MHFVGRASGAILKMRHASFGLFLWGLSWLVCALSRGLAALHVVLVFTQLLAFADVYR